MIRIMLTGGLSTRLVIISRLKLPVFKRKTSIALKLFTCCIFNCFSRNIATVRNRLGNGRHAKHANS